MSSLWRTGEPGTISLADRAREAGDWMVAARHYRAALLRNPDNPPIWVQYGHALKESGLLLQAEAAYRRAIAAEPEVADTHLQLGHVLKLMHRPGEARSAYLRALALDPDSGPARYELPDHRWDEAELADTRRELAAAAASPRRGRPRSSIASADLARDLGQWETAARFYHQALERNPRRPEIWAQYGHMLKQSGGLAEAEAAYRQALAADGQMADVHLHLGHTLKLRGKTEEAVAAYLRAFVAAPGLPDAAAELRAAGWTEREIAELEQQAARPSEGGAATPSATSVAANVSPRFSVVMPVYGRTWELREALDSVLAQSFADFELIIVTDASPPATMDIVREYLDKDSRVRAFFYDDNSGNACRGRNRGIIEARGEFISLIDSDDQYFPDTLEKAYRIFQERDVDFVCGRAYFIVDGTRKVGDFVTGSTNTVGPISLDRLLRENPIQTCTVHVRRDLLMRHGGFRIEQRYLEDLELWARLAHRGCRFHFTDELLAKYRFHEGNHELTYIERTPYWFEHLRNNYLRPFDDWGIGPARDRSDLDTGNADDVPVWPGRVDARWYLGQYLDVARAALDPVTHFASHGRREGRKPNAAEARVDGWVSVVDTELSCAKTPLWGEEVILFVTHSPHGRLKPHVRHYLASLTRQDISVVLIVAADAPFTADSGLLNSLDGLFVRQNIGFDFAAWAHVIRLHPELHRAKILYLANDSVFGPVNDAAFGSLIGRIRASEADFIGLTESFEQGWHFQSYFIALKSRALNSRAFDGFIESIRGYLDKQQVIDEYELRFAATMRIGGLRCEAMFGQTGFANPTLFQWKGLLAAGFPFLKVVTVRDEFPGIDVSDWRQTIGDLGYDASLAARTLDEVLSAKDPVRDEMPHASTRPGQAESLSIRNPRVGVGRAIIFSHDLSGSGAPKIVYDVARALLAQGWLVTVMSPEDGVTRQRLMDLGAEVLINPLAPSIDYPDRVTHESIITLAGSFDLVILNTVVCWPLAMRLGALDRVFWYVHESGLVHDFARSYKQFVPSFGEVTGVWTGSSRSAVALREIGVETVVLEYGIDNWADGAPRHPSAEIVISLLASCERRKGQDLAVLGFRGLSEAVKDRCRLQLAGRVLQPEFDASVRELAAGEPKITFQTELSAAEYASVLQQSDVILCPSRDDTLPLVSLDALAAGKILICSKEVGTSDYLVDGVSAFVIPDNTPEGIAATLGMAIDRQREWPAIRAAARRLVADRFSHERFARRLRTLIGSASADRFRAAS